ncbi:hypothetical protein FB451DRAFT_1273280 [Mycena latifolia]|nr:hypothetical protein FB451DRAFT_1273280 [Mycena latifolia]
MVKALWACAVREMKGERLVVDGSGGQYVRAPFHPAPSPRTPSIQIPLRESIRRTPPTDTDIYPAPARQAGGGVRLLVARVLVSSSPCIVRAPCARRPRRSAPLHVPPTRSLRSQHVSLPPRLRPRTAPPCPRPSIRKGALALATPLCLVFSRLDIDRPVVSARRARERHRHVTARGPDSTSRRLCLAGASGSRGSRGGEEKERMHRGVAAAPSARTRERRRARLRFDTMRDGEGWRWHQKHVGTFPPLMDLAPDSSLTGRPAASASSITYPPRGPRRPSCPS